MWSVLNFSIQALGDHCVSELIKEGDSLNYFLEHFRVKFRKIQKVPNFSVSQESDIFFFILNLLLKRAWKVFKILPLALRTIYIKLIGA